MLPIHQTDTVRGPSPAEARARLERLAAPAASPLPLPRVLVVLAHPDDEVLAFGARLERLAASHLLTLTDGAPRDGADARHHGFASLDAYRNARAEELAAALAHAGLSPALAGPLPEIGTIPVSDQEAALHLPALVRAVAAAIRDLAPEIILTHPYEGGHPDHDACAFAVHTAVGRLESESAPVIAEAPFYHAGEGGSMRTGHFLHELPEATVVQELSPLEQANKRARLACFQSQTETLGQFGVATEAFRLAPACDFTLPPHAGELLYEHFGWGMTGERFRSLAAAASVGLKVSTTQAADLVVTA